MKNIEKIREKILKNSLESAIKSFIDNATIEELKEQFEWYKVDTIYDLKNIMFESYLDNYNEEELKEKIKMLYE